VQIVRCLACSSLTKIPQNFLPHPLRIDVMCWEPFFSDEKIASCVRSIAVLHIDPPGTSLQFEGFLSGRWLTRLLLFFQGMSLTLWISTAPSSLQMLPNKYMRRLATWGKAICFTVSF
jgi:hypothetical protein